MGERTQTRETVEDGRVATGETMTEKENGRVAEDEGTVTKDVERTTEEERAASEMEKRKKDDIGGERETMILKREENGRAAEKKEDTGGERETLTEGKGGMAMSQVDGRAKEKTAAAADGMKERLREMVESGTKREDLIKDQTQREKEALGKVETTVVDERTKGFTRTAIEEEEGFQRKENRGEERNRTRRRGAVRNLLRRK